MISAKGLRPKSANPANPDRYELKEELSGFRLPALVGLMLASLMLYLRSFLPVDAKSFGEASPPKAPPTDPDDGAAGAPIDISATGTGMDALGDGTQGHHTPDIAAGGETDPGPAVLRSRGYATPHDANVIKPHELNAISAGANPANTNFFGMPRDSIQNFPSLQSGFHWQQRCWRQWRWQYGRQWQWRQWRQRQWRSGH